MNSHLFQDINVIIILCSESPVMCLDMNPCHPSNMYLLHNNTSQAKIDQILDGMARIATDVALLGQNDEDHDKSLYNLMV